MGCGPRVSVVVIFRDAEPFLDEAIGSVFAQTYADWELLLVDDGSVDGGPARAAAWAAEHPERVQVLQHPGGINRGMSASRNLGIRHARGEYLAFLDADDVWLPRTLTEQVGVLDTWPEAAMVYGPIQYWYGWTGLPEDRKRDYVEPLGVASDALVYPPKLLPLFLLDKAAVPSGILVRRDTVVQVGGFEETFRGEYEDQVFCAKVCLKQPVFASSHCWYRYRQHPNSCVSMGQLTGQSSAARLAFLNWLRGYLSDHKSRHPAVWWALRYELWRCNHPTQYRLWERGRQVIRRLIGSIALSSGRVAEGAR